MRVLNPTSETRAAALLGGSKALQLEGAGPLMWVFAIRKGFPILALDSLGQNINVTSTELAQIIGISARALSGRRRKGLLSSFESERLLRLAKVFARAESVFDDIEKGLAWLKETNISLGGETPISLLDTEIGAELVTGVLGRIQHGVFA